MDSISLQSMSMLESLSYSFAGASILLGNKPLMIEGFFIGVLFLSLIDLAYRSLSHSSASVVNWSIYHSTSSWAFYREI